MTLYYYAHFLQPPLFYSTVVYIPPYPSPLRPLQELKLPVYRAHSPQIGMRRYFADLLAILSNRYQLCPTARHLAVYLLDLFMDHYDVAVKQLYVIALSCLLLASKSIISLPPLSVYLRTCLFFVFFAWWEHLFWDQLFTSLDDVLKIDVLETVFLKSKSRTVVTWLKLGFTFHLETHCTFTWSVNAEELHCKYCHILRFFDCGLCR